jgi:hypothetical protein
MARRALRRELMSVFMRKSIQSLLIIGVGMMSWGLARAQVAPPLSPGFLDTTTTKTEPVTNLTYDLLVPQRPSIFDPTGASILTNSLNPEIIATDFSSAVTQTDTALRNSTQSGRFNPYGANAARSALIAGGESDDATAMTVATRVRPGQNAGIGSSGGTIVPGNDADYDPGYDAEPNSVYHSSWGGNSAAGAPDASSWGVKATPVTRIGRRMDSSSTASIEGPYVGAEGQSQGDGAADSGSIRAGGLSQTGGFSQMGGSQIGVSQMGGAQTASRSGRGSGGLGSLQSATPGGNSSALSGRAAAGYGVGTAFGSRDSQRSPEDLLGGAGMSGVSGIGGRASGLGGGAQAPKTLEAMMLFSPHSYLGYSFGSTPFAPPAFGEANFLNPNIFDTIPVVLSGGAQTMERARRLYRRSKLGEDNGLETSESQYGLSSQLGMEQSRLSTRHLGGNTSARRLLAKSRTGTENPYRSSGVAK